MTWSFRSLNLEHVDVQRGGSLKPGRYVCRVTEAKIRETRSGGHQVEVALADTGGTGTVRDFISVHVPSSEVAQRIGQERLKALLVHGGHPSPDYPGDIKSLEGLVVGVNVEQGDDYVKDGETRKGGGRPVERGAAYFDPAELGFSRSGPPPLAGGVSGFDDSIPFAPW